MPNATFTRTIVFTPSNDPTGSWRARAARAATPGPRRHTGLRAALHKLLHTS